MRRDRKADLFMWANEHWMIDAIQEKTGLPLKKLYMYEEDLTYEKAAAKKWTDLAKRP